MEGTETIIRHRKSHDLDRWGEPVTPEPDLPITRCIVVPRGIGGENNQNASTVISGLQVFLPPGTDIRASDRITVRGKEYAVDGEPADYRSLAGVPKKILINLKRVTG